MLPTCNIFGTSRRKALFVLSFSFERMFSMKSLTIALLGLAIIGCQGNAQSKKSTTELKTQKDTVSYTIGLSIGKNMKQQEVDIDADLLLTGLKAGLSDDTTKVLLTEQQMSEAMQRFQMAMMQKQQEKMQKLSSENRAKGEKFLADNKGKAGVQTTASGLQYKVITEGSGPSPTASSTVKVNYKGSLVDGKVFDSSYDNGQPATFQVGQVIKGWQEGLQLMKKGAKYEFYIPADLAYGEQAPPSIGPGSVLIFEVELLEIQ
jgi:FKBP-type peptidyl-prolyl cis-trans isomerase